MLNKIKSFLEEKVKDKNQIIAEKSTFTIFGTLLLVTGVNLMPTCDCTFDCVKAAVVIGLGAGLIVLKEKFKINARWVK